MAYPSVKHYLNEVCSYVKHKRAHKKIREELFSHIEDKRNDLHKNIPWHEATQLTLKSMGDPEKIGRELNKQHKRILAWLSYLFNILILGIVFYFLFILVTNTIGAIGPMNYYEQDISSELGYLIEVDKKITIDDRVVVLKDVVVFEDSVHIYYNTYHKYKLNFPHLWKSAEYWLDFTEVYDDLGNQYDSANTLRTPKSTNVFIVKTLLKIENFDSQANTLTLRFDEYNRVIEFTVILGDE